MCFIYDKVSDSLMSKLLDPSLRPIKLSEKGRALMGQKWIEPGGDLSQLTYGDVDGKALKFIAGNLHRPLKRVLNFQARNARIFAKDNGWISDSWDFEDFEDEGLSVTDKVERWLISVWSGALALIPCASIQGLRCKFRAWRLEEMWQCNSLTSLCSLKHYGGCEPFHRSSSCQVLFTSCTNVASNSASMLCDL